MKPSKLSKHKTKIKEYKKASDLVQKIVLVIAFLFGSPKFRTGERGHEL